MSKKCIGYAMCGSFCTFSKAIEQMKNLIDLNYDVLPIMSIAAYSTDTRFGKAKDFISQIEEITKKKIVNSISMAEPIGPKKMCDLLLISPCTGNTLGKISQGITDTPVTMAAKSHLRVLKPLLLCVATNDGLGASAQNIGRLLNTKNVFFVPMSQDDPENKPNSLVSHFELIPQCVEQGLSRIQSQPVFR
ncbi:MAG: dipicolinate synthase subunit B [Ruminococcaceae bacterium]|nr:dipicolinate synthase subunit B [Oscillospiraceae bacterium]